MITSFRRHEKLHFSISTFQLQRTINPGVAAFIRTNRYIRTACIALSMEDGFEGNVEKLRAMVEDICKKYPLYA